jgi:hypothetical protein
MQQQKDRSRLRLGVAEIKHCSPSLLCFYNKDILNRNGLAILSGLKPWALVSEH